MLHRLCIDNIFLVKANDLFLITIPYVALNVRIGHSTIVVCVVNGLPYLNLLHEAH